MIRPISLLSEGLISNSLKTKSIASNGLLLSTVIPLPEIVTPKTVYSVDHKLNKIKKIRKINEQDEKEIIQLIEYISKRIL